MTDTTTLFTCNVAGCACNGLGGPFCHSPETTPEPEPGVGPVWMERCKYAEHDYVEVRQLPAIYCRKCGASRSL
jgi:hypothetical protein